MQIIVVKANEKAYAHIIYDYEREIKEIIGGEYEMFKPYDDNVAILYKKDDKGERNRAVFSEDNRILKIIRGNFVVVGIDKKDNFVSLDKVEAMMYKAVFMYPHSFHKREGRIVVNEIQAEVKKYA